MPDDQIGFDEERSSLIH